MQYSLAQFNQLISSYKFYILQTELVPTGDDQKTEALVPDILKSMNCSGSRISVNSLYIVFFLIRVFNLTSKGNSQGMMKRNTEQFKTLKL